ncbi:MAG TPA: toll/interleukin-1 receptor domain-containing protein, partial [Anaerovoracaceae bacterium]|nr:toll/interleukin-1 receptor domain-containing protein [Anaerovoracaceae bacterium]
MSTAPNLFISYSWSTPAHEQWVIDLAERLTHDGVHVIIDKWDLREGHDAHAFMEQMVTRADIKKVAAIFDKAYARKADERDRGVGTETRLITGEIYKQSGQDKFVAVIAEKDEDGKPYLPAYYSGRIYIDLANASRIEEEYERLLRWI